MNGSDVKEHLFALVNKGIKYDLDRMRNAAACINNPQFEYKSFHVAGTNGKGSTCTYLESILRKSGFKTGLYTSPHIVRFEERFMIDGKEISEQQWLSVYKDMKSVIEQFNLTFFEASTLIAFELFKRENVQWAVFETGLGGRLDATNIINPQVSVITRIAMDHMDLLGTTLIDIAQEKFGIIKDNTPVVFAQNSDPAVMDAFKKTCAIKNAPYRIAEITERNAVHQEKSGMYFTYKGMEYQLGLHGTFQALNALIALNALEVAGIDNLDLLKNGLSDAFIPGRFQEIVHKGQTFLIDVGHNPDAAEMLVWNLKNKYPDKSICFITGIMKDKDFKKVISTYLQIAARVILSRPQVERAATAEMLFNIVQPDLKQKCMIIESIPDAVDTATEENFDLICITGSFYTVGEVCQYMGIHLEQ